MGSASGVLSILPVTNAADSQSPIALLQAGDQSVSNMRLVVGNYGTQLGGVLLAAIPGERRNSMICNALECYHGAMFFGF